MIINFDRIKNAFICNLKGLNFQYNLGHIQNLPAAKFDKRVNSWLILACSYSAEYIKKYCKGLNKESIRTLNLYLYEYGYKEVSPIYPDGWEHLWEHQAQFIGYIEFWNNRALGALDMGTGKTFSTMAWMSMHPEMCPFIIVCPAALKLMWYNEITKRLPKYSVQIVNGRSAPVLYSDVVIINYELIAYIDPEEEEDAKELLVEYENELLKLKKENVSKSRIKTIEELIRKEKKIFEKERLSMIECLPELYNYGFNAAIFDECQKLSSMESQKTSAAFDLTSQINNLIFLTGTPIRNKPQDILPVLKMLNPRMWSSSNFKRKYCGYRKTKVSKTRFVWKCNEPENLNELHNVLSQTIMFRRTKKDVMSYLPSRIMSMIPLEIDNREDYKQAEANILTYIATNYDKKRAADAEKAEKLIQTGVLSRLTIKGKLSSLITWVEDFINTGEKLLIFFKNTEPLNDFCEHFKKICVKVDGSTSNPEKVKEKFVNNKDIRILAGNVLSAGTGLNGMQHVCSNVAFAQVPDNPDDVEQGIGRLERGGQKQATNVYWLIAHDTVEINAIERNDHKRMVAEAIVDGRVPDKQDFIGTLLKRLKRR